MRGPSGNVQVVYIIQCRPNLVRGPSGNVQVVYVGLYNVGLT